MKKYLRSMIGLRSPIRLAWHLLKGVSAYLLSGNPAKHMTIIGVTGTKGKTTTSTMIAQGLRDAGHRVFLFTTAHYWIGDKEYINNFKMTNGNPFMLWRLIRQAKNQGCTHMVLETSSHGIYYFRNFGITYDVVALTNISQDHLDLHGSMQHYVDTKKRIFNLSGSFQVEGRTKERKIVINIDSEYFQDFNALSVPKISYGHENVGAHLQAQNINSHAQGMNFSIHYEGDVHNFHTPLIGKFNISNILATIGVLSYMDIPFIQIKSTVNDFKGVAGRMESVDNNRGVRILVDYAHTEESLQSVMETLMPTLGDGKLILVFGATGDRDTTKRPKMGEVADRFANTIILTDDDTYTEDSRQIINMVDAGIDRQEWDDYYIIADRKQAIIKGCELSESGDILLIAGKGSENVQVTNEGSIPWSDKGIVEEFLQE